MGVVRKVWGWILGALAALWAVNKSHAGELEPNVPADQPTADGWRAPTWHVAPSTNAQRAENYAAVQAYGDRLVDLGLYEGPVGDYLKVVSYTESRGNPSAGDQGRNNKARGLFGLRPESAWDEREHENLTAGQYAAMRSMPYAIAMQANFMNRLYSYLDPGQDMTTIALRRGQAYPRLVSDTDNNERPELVSRWNQATGFFGYGSGFANERIRKRVARSEFPDVATLARMLGGGPL